MEISKHFANAKTLMVGAVLAVAMALACSSLAFADTNVKVSGTFSDGTAISEDVNLDDLYESGLTPVYGMYYKSSAWNVLATTSYVSVEDVMNEAISQYNYDNKTKYTLANLYTASKKMTLTVADDGGTTYTKYYPTYADIFSTKSFFGGALNTNSTLTGSLLTSTNPTGAVLAKSYGLAATASGATASTAASAALAKESVTSEYPRLITGCATDMTTSTAMGKRYVYDVTGITLS
jgi:hypothetical protein